MKSSLNKSETEKALEDARAFMQKMKVGDVIYVLGDPNMIGDDKEYDDYLAMHDVTVVDLPEVREIRPRRVRELMIIGTIASDMFGNVDEVRQLWEHANEQRRGTWEEFSKNLMTHEVWIRPFGMHEGSLFLDKIEARKARLIRMREHSKNLANELLSISKEISAEEESLRDTP